MARNTSAPTTPPAMAPAFAWFFTRFPLVALVWSAAAVLEEVGGGVDVVEVEVCVEADADSARATVIVPMLEHWLIHQMERNTYASLLYQGRKLAQPSH